MRIWDEVVNHANLDWDEMVNALCLVACIVVWIVILFA